VKPAHALAALGLVAVLTHSTPAVPSTPCSGPELTPNLVADVPIDVDVRRAGNRSLLVFRTSMHNAGAGPLRLVGQRRSRRTAQMRVDQSIDCADGGAAVHSGEGRLRYIADRTHGHWHYAGLARYSLGGRRAHKAGFCLGDFEDAGTSPPGKPDGPVFDRSRRTACGAHRPRALRVTQGLSVGWADSYAPYVAGQFITLDGLPDGTYRLLNEIDPAGALVDGDDADDVAGVDVQLTWRRARATVRITGSCAGRLACGQPAAVRAR
jgi:hypothetical protein